MAYQMPRWIQSICPTYKGYAFVIHEHLHIFGCRIIFSIT